MAEKILILGATGYIGKYITKASIALGYPTFVFVRPSSSQDKAKAEFLDSIKASGATILHGSLEDYASLLAAIKQADIVISAVGPAQIHDQYKVIEAIKEAGTVKRFLPSEFGNNPAVAKKIHPVLQGMFGLKLQLRKTIEEAGIPHTYVSTNSFAGYFLANLAQPGQFSPPRDKVTIWGDGNTKLVIVEEGDIGTYTIKSAVDPRTLNQVVYFRPPANIVSQNEIVELWEKKIGKTLEKSYVPEEAILKTIEETPFPNNLFSAITHCIFVQGDQYGFDVEYDTAKLYPDVKYTTVDEYLSRLV
ncbi:hypothetical protein SELMODRAFT_159626 [Selaginella moellendorffii]|uniref:NmrA-like domain-containing protein n=1 Tax=Selaginella moellendorffii TaxID=88036 RepID=D8SZ88_SELML|nr:isoflavone reductase homolog IRL1 [Selaginella moellendorffii]EFJ10243.1 hypothetical protein SELMODRAFT_159626 [Selaginella moellendorffii]|eukprot:XP_002988732.1 isoflavone reductase homolog IRL1 [Selaginella moellendorffii]